MVKVLVYMASITGSMLLNKVFIFLELLGIKHVTVILWLWSLLSFAN